MSRLHLILFLALIPLPLSAQTLFACLGKHHLPYGTSTTTDVAVGDLDGDGDLDLVWANRGPNRIQLNDGHGRFSDHPSPLAGSNDSEAVVLGDLDGDGDLDLVIGNNFQANRLLLNDGQGNFTDVTATALPVQPDGTNALILGDVDGDGDLDLLWNSFTTSTDRVQLLLNNGSGVFTHQADLAIQGSTSLALGDLDGDGDLDLVCGRQGHDVLLLNNGRGGFNQAPAANLPAVTSWTRALALHDLDGDGDLDIFCANVSATGMDPQNRLFLNNGLGVFTDATATNLPVGGLSAAAVAVGDVDGDGDADISLGITEYFNGDHLFLNNGKGQFTRVTAARFPRTRYWTEAIAMGDMDRDGDLDIVAGSLGSYDYGAPNKLYFNDGTGVFTDVTAGKVIDKRRTITDIHFFDADGDGDLDLATVGDLSGFGVDLYLNDGTGGFEQLSPGFSGPVYSSIMASGDIDGDGTVDMVLLWQLTLTAFLNNGKAGFNRDTTGMIPPISSGRESVLLGDVDGDGDLDLITGGTPLRYFHILLNDGTGRFTEVTSTNITSPPDLVSCMQLADVDGDGDLDLICGRDGTNDRLYGNDGTGRFTVMPLPLDTDRTASIATLDVDGDGDLDLAWGTYSGQHRLYRNDGKGGFTDISAGNLPATTGTWKLIAGDMDGDGKEDLVAGGTTSMVLLRGDGSGRFIDISSSALPPYVSHADIMSAGDLDGDGDLDLAICNLDQNLTVFANLSGQTGAPYIAAPGRPYQLDICGRFLPAPNVIVAIPLWSLARADIPFGPFGRLFLDMNKIHALPSLVSQGGSLFSKRIGFTVPANPSLIGSTIYFQSFLAALPHSGALEGRFTNLVAETISGL